MNEDNRVKPNYNDPQYDHKFNANERQYEKQYGQTSYMPNHYNDRGYTDSFYYENEDSGAGSFLVGAIVGGVIGAAAALFLAPKTGKEMREDLSTQAGNLKDKSIEISAVAKDKATEYTSVAKDKTVEFTAVAKDKTAEFTTVAKEKTDGISKTIQKQSGQLVDKVKSMTAKKSTPLDDGTAFSDEEGASEFVEEIAEEVNENLADSVEEPTAVAEALKEAVTGEVTK